MKQEKENVESKQDFKEVFRKLVRRVIEKSRCEKVLAAISDLRRDREAFEKLCFQFNEDEESALYRYKIAGNGWKPSLMICFLFAENFLSTGKKRSTFGEIPGKNICLQSCQKLSRLDQTSRLLRSL